nr:wd-40 repeat-containing protein msi3 [Quercus suber]
MIWDLRTNQPQQSVKAHEREVNYLSFNPYNERILATASSDTTIGLFDTRKLSVPLHVLSSHTNPLGYCCFSPCTGFSALGTAGFLYSALVSLHWIVDLKENIFLFKFACEGDKKRILELGPWNIEGFPLILKMWHQNLSVEDMDFSSIPIWIQVHNLSIEYMSKENAKEIGALVREVIEADKKGGKPVSNSSRGGPNEVIDKKGLIDLQFSGNPYTWSNKREGFANIKERLDRAFANERWRLIFPRATIHNLPASSSDHSPIVLFTEGEQRDVKKPFKFEEAWTRDETSFFVVEKAWRSDVYGTSLYKVCRKIKETKREFRRWNKEWFGNI